MKLNIGLFYLIACIFFLIQNSASAAQKNNDTCGIVPGKPLHNGYGPFDYTNPAHKPKFPIVLNAHFTPQVERLEKGSTGALPHDIDYTLRAIPNYHRALNAISRFEIRANQPTRAFSEFYSAECFFKRAIYFQPRDAVTRMLYGIHLHKLKNYEGAETLYKQALSISPDNPEISYNLGLLYVNTGKSELAKKYADIAYKGGYPLPGLKNLIMKAEKNSN